VNVPALFTRYREAVIAEMRDVIGDDDALLYRIIRYHLGWEEPDGRPGPGLGGKALRPALCLLACEGTGGRVEQCLPAAAAIELIHNFSLIHDDIQDEDRERHGRPTVWTIWGVPQGINAGDGLWALAGRSFLRLAQRGVPPERIVRAYMLLNEACLTIIEGQALDLAFEARAAAAAAGNGLTPVDVPAYLDMIDRKTGALIGAALAVGALIGCGDETVAQCCHHLGRLLGRVFQIQDDILGIWGDDAVTGKSTSSDIRRRKQSYPVVYTLTRGPAAARAELAAVYALPQIDDAAVARAVRAMEAAGAREQAAALARQAYTEALALLETLPLSAPARSDLHELAAFLLDRPF
jgi:geranylgeranyl diphosphate synthase type I